LKPILFDLLERRRKCGQSLVLTESYRDVADCGRQRASILATPQAEYFGVARVGAGSGGGLLHARRGVDMETTRHAGCGPIMD
jgi:hypothetical protein